MNFFKSVLANFSSQVVSRIVSSATGFVVTILVARSFGIGGYSDLAKITAFVGLLYLGVDLGANAIFLQIEKNKEHVYHFFSFRLLLAFIIFLCVLVIVPFLPYSSLQTSGYSPFVKIGIIFFSLSFFAKAVTTAASALFQQAMQYQKAAVASAIGSLVALAVVLCAVFVRASLFWVVAGYLFGSFAEALAAYFLIHQKIYLSIDKEFFKRLLVQTAPLFLLLFLNLFYFRIDMILLTFFQKATAVGVYDYAYKYFDFLIALPLFLSNTLYPMFLREEKNSRIQRKNISLYTLLFLGLGCLLVPVVWFGAPLIAYVKQDFTPAILPLRLLSLSLPVFFATNILQWIFITKKKQTFLVYVYGASLALNILLNVIFIPRFSYAASAIITGFSELLIFLIMIVYALIIY